MNSAVISSGDRSASDALGLWEPKRTLTLEAARKHTARIKVMRYVLLAICAGLAAYLVYEFATQSNTTFIDDNPTESVKMSFPRYSGRTTDGLPFYLTAESATRTLANKTEVALIKPVLEFIREDGAEASIVLAETGTYDDVNKILNLRNAYEINDNYKVFVFKSGMDAVIEQDSVGDE